jgi:hypothetical protein
MKIIIALAFSLCIIICFSRCNQKPAQELPSSNPDSVKKTIIALNEGIFRSLDNPEKFRTFYEDSILSAFTNGEIKTSSIALSHELWHNYILPHDYSFRLFGNTAILSYLFTHYAIHNKDTILHNIRSTKTFVFNNGQWKVACSAGTEIYDNHFKPIIDKHEKDYASYAGYYQSNKGEIDTVFVKDGKLYDKSGGDGTLNFPVSDGEYMIKGDFGRLSFGKDSKGVVTYYTITDIDGQQWVCPKIK